MSNTTDLDVEYDDPNGDLEIEIESDDSQRGILDGKLPNLDPSHVLEILGR
jgi:hypothetical protein